MQHADRIFINANIYTMENQSPYATAIAVSGQDILAAGTTEELLARFADTPGKTPEIIDLEGKTVIPGLIESHLHTILKGNSLMSVNCEWQQKDEILRRVKEAAMAAPEGSWVEGFGWNQSLWPDKEFPTKEELDEVSFGHPVVLQRICGHCIWANSKALEIAGVTTETPDPMGGEFLKNPDGSLRGILTDTAMNILSEAMPKLTVPELRTRILKVQDILLSYGLTAADEMGVGATVAAGNHPEEETLQAHRELCEEGLQKIRYYIYIFLGETLDRYMKLGPQIGLYDDHLTIRGQKMFADGALGARSAWLLEDYADRPGHKGNGRFTTEDLVANMKEAKAAGFQTSLHAIGDAAVRQALDAYDLVNPEGDDIRFKIEHFMIAHDEDFRRLGAGSMIASMQYVELSTDQHFIEDRIGMERAEGAYAWRKVLNAGGKLAAGSDCPMDSPNPYESLYYAVTRRSIEGGPNPAGFFPDQALTRYEALYAYTMGGAYARFEEDRIGSIKEGKHADFVVLDRDYFTCPTEEIKEIRALRTVIGGETVYLAD